MMLYNNHLDNFYIWSSLGFFLIFLVYVLFGKLAAGENSYSNVNRGHKIILIPFITFIVVYTLIIKPHDLSFVSGMIISIFIYFTLQYVFLFALIGIAKKSISINILACIEELKAVKGNVNLDDLSRYMNEKKLGFNEIRNNRLGQMLFLGFSERQEKSFLISFKGRKVNAMGRLILKIWNLKRL